MPKKDYKQLKGILEESDRETVLKVLREQDLKLEELYQPIKKTIKDFPDFEIGSISKVGDKNFVSHEAYVEARDIERWVEEPEFLPVHFLECGWNRQGAVARVRIPGYWWGTGFLVSNSLFMTNNHVVPNEDIGSKAKVQFNYQLDHDGTPLQTDTYDGDPESFFYTNSSLDFTIMKLKAHRRFILPWRVLQREQVMEAEDLIAVQRSYSDLMATFYRYSHAGDTWGHIDLRDNIMALERVNIIQHPSTRYKEICLHDNKLTYIYTNVVRYRTDTEPGSSGSPVFDNTWDIIAIHHAAGSRDAAGNWINNEGIRIDRIIDDLQNSLRGTSEEGILTELGIP